MEPRPQATFIPKKPVTSTDSERSGIGFFSLVALVIFLSTVLAGIGVVGYRITLTKQVEIAKKDLKANEDKFDANFIALIVRLNTRIEAAKQLLKNHVAISSIFEALQRDTIQTVQFLNFGFSSTPAGNTTLLKVSMKGVAKDYNSLAYQSEVIGQNRYIKDQLFSSFSLTEEERVTFGFDALIDPNLIDYRQRGSADLFNNLENRPAASNLGATSTRTTATTSTSTLPR